MLDTSRRIDSSGEMMSAGSEPSKAGPDGEAERKMWFDYLKALTDHHLQSAQRSGFTNYVLIAVLIGMVVQFVPKLPAILGGAGAKLAILVSLLLLTNSIAYLLYAYGLLVSYTVGGGTDNRVIPDSKRRTVIVATWVLLFFQSMFSVLQLWVGFMYSLRSNFVKWLLIMLGLWWAANSFQAIRKQIRVGALSRLHGVQMPLFAAKTFEINVLLAMAVFCAAVAALSCAGLMVYLHGLAMNWIQPLGTAAVCLTFLFVCGLLLKRGFSAVAERTYDTLLRSILVDRLDAEAIRTAFIRTTLGPETVAWLDDLLKGLTVADAALKKALDSARQEAAEIPAIALEPDSGRLLRAKGAFEELEARMKQHELSFKAIIPQLELFIQENRSEEEIQALKQFGERAAEHIRASKEILVESRRVLAELRGLLETGNFKAAALR